MIARARSNNRTVAGQNDPPRSARASLQDDAQFEARQDGVPVDLRQVAIGVAAVAFDEFLRRGTTGSQHRFLSGRYQVAASTSCNGSPMVHISPVDDGHHVGSVGENITLAAW